MRKSVIIIPLLLAFLFSIVMAQEDWTSQSVDFRMGGQSRIKKIRYPAAMPPRLTQDQQPSTSDLDALNLHDQADTDDAASDIVIASPPLAGFVPWIALTATNKRKDELELEAESTSTVMGAYMTADPQLNFAIGLFDTGAGAHVISYENAQLLGIQGSFLTDNYISVQGVTGSVDMLVSQPFAPYVAGFNEVEPNAVLHLDNLVGEYNVSVGVGTAASPYLPTALGMPLAIFYTAVFYNDTSLTVTRGEESYVAPDIRFYSQDDPAIPQYDISVPLELRPLGAQSVQYTPDMDAIIGWDEIAPQTPSIITGLGAQSLYFVHSVDLYHTNRSAIDRDRFMLDTGAQVSVIGNRIAARIGLDHNNPDFEAEVEGVNGQSLMMPGFIIDRLEIPALGQWLTYTDVPVILLDVSSPEGGTLDGIIGMNLMVQYNMVLRNGGMMLQDDPALEVSPINTATLTGDIAPASGDGKVDMMDLTTLASAWLLTDQSDQWNPLYDIAPSPRDSIVNLHDYAVIAQNWITQP